MITFSNPRLHAEFNDWPSGRNRVRCVFTVERHPKRGYRFTRTTTGKPKTDTYGGKCAIVDGSDGRTYLLQRCDEYGFVKVSQSDFMDARKEVIGFMSAVFPDNPMYTIIRSLIDQANNQDTVNA